MSILDPIEFKITAIPVTQEEWVKGNYTEIGCVRYSPLELEARIKGRFIEDTEEGMGKYWAAAFRLPNGRQFGLLHYFAAPIKVPATAILCLDDERFEMDFEDVLESLDMDLSDVLVLESKPVISSRVRLVPFTLCRQDDYGSKTVVEIFPCRANASKRMRELEALGHKQTYWIESRPASTDHK